MRITPTRGSQRRPRLRDSAAVRRRRQVAGVALFLLGLSVLAFGVVAGRADPPAPVSVDPDGTTAVPTTSFYQSPWVLYGRLDDPRRPPSLEEVGCRPVDGLELPTQPDDPSSYGSRVVDDVPIDAVALLGRSGQDAALTCSAAGAYGPLWLMPASEARPFTATGIAIVGALLLVAAALTHPSTTEPPRRWWQAWVRRRTGRSRLADQDADR